jgi:dipeptidyl aminopeptidase/acylaminoacyl peptidase
MLPLAFNRFLKRSALHKTFASIVFGAALLITCAAPARESVRSELTRLQDTRGYRLVSVRDNQIVTLLFPKPGTKVSKTFSDKGNAATGTVSPDGTRIAVTLCQEPGLTHPTPYQTDCPGGFVLAILRTDGSELKTYPGLEDASFACWSHDMSKLVLTASDRRTNRYANLDLQILDIATERTEVVADGSTTFTESQCWSPDDTKFVYTVNKDRGIQIVRLYDTQTKKSTDVAGGGHATWSPDGKRIAFLYCPPTLYGCQYDELDPFTGTQKLIFKADGESGLAWSPDSRFASYVSGAGFLERKPSQEFEEMGRLRVRRLEDGAEVPYADFFDGDIMWFDWVGQSEK